MRRAGWSLLAQEESRLLQHDYIGTEHLLIAATEVEERLTDGLGELGITTEVVRGQVTRMVAPTSAEPASHVSFTAEATQALEGSRREALQLGHNYIGPGHIVLGLLGAHDGTMPVLLTRLGVSAEVLRAKTVALFDDAPPIEGRVKPVLAPLCPRCSGPLVGNVRLVAVDADGERLRLACCRLCGAVLPALPAP